MWDEKWILCSYWRWPAQLVNWEDSRARLVPKKGLVTGLLIRYSFLSPDETITSEWYAQQIDEMHQKLQCLQLALVNRMGPVLLHNNFSLHITQPTLQKLNKMGYEVLPRPPYSPDLCPADYHFFRNLDDFLQGEHLRSQQEAGRKCFPRVE